MGTLRYHGNGGLDCRSINGLNTFLFAGSNVEITKDQYDICKNHPYLKNLLDLKVLEYVRTDDKVEAVDLGVPIRTIAATGEKYPVIDAEIRQSLGDGLPLTVDESGEVKQQNTTKKKEKVIKINPEDLEGTTKISSNPYDL